MIIPENIYWEFLFENHLRDICGKWKTYFLIRPTLISLSCHRRLIRLVILNTCCIMLLPNWQIQLETICRTYNFQDIILLLPHARFRAWPRWMKHPAKRPVAKTLPKLHGNYYSSINIYKETNINFKLLLGNRFRNYFQISYRRHKCFVPFLIFFNWTRM